LEITYGTLISSKNFNNYNRRIKRTQKRQIEKLTIEEIKWLLFDYNKIRGYGKVNSWIDWHVRAQQLLKGNAEKPSCSCSWAATARVSNSMYDQFEQQLKDRLVFLETPVIDELPKVKTRGRKASKTNTGEE
jgi:hypothetical protein